MSRLCLGTMTFAMTGANPRLCDKKTAFALLDRFLEAGGNFIDTADVYSVRDMWKESYCDTFVTRVTGRRL